MPISSLILRNQSWFTHRYTKYVHIKTYGGRFLGISQIEITFGDN